MGTNFPESGPGRWEDSRGESRVTSSQGGTGKCPRRAPGDGTSSQPRWGVCCQKASGCTSGGPLAFVSSSVTGLDTQQEQNIKAATECCVSFGSFNRPPRWPLPVWGTHIIFIWSSWAAIFRCNWQKTQPVQLPASLRVKSTALESWGSCLRKR